MRGRRRARTSDLMIRSPPPSWDTILDRIASDRCQPRAGLQGIPNWRQRPLSISPNGRYGTLDRVTASVRLDVEGPDDVAPLLGFVGDEPAKVCGRDDKRRASKVVKPCLHLGSGEARVDLL